MSTPPWFAGRATSASTKYGRAEIERDFQTDRIIVKFEDGWWVAMPESEIPATARPEWCFNYAVLVRRRIDVFGAVWLRMYDEERVLAGLGAR